MPNDFEVKSTIAFWGLDFFMSARGLGVPGLLEDGMMDGWLDYREYNLNANAISTTYNLSNYLLK